MSSHEPRGSLYKTKGIILRSIRLREADRIVTVLTESKGKIGAVAKGVRKTKSKFGARLEPFNLVELLLYKGSNLDTITSVEIINPFSSIRNDFNKATYALAMLDLIDKVSLDVADKRVFDFLITGFEALSALDINLDLFLAAFDLKLLSLSGFMPILGRCLSCGLLVSLAPEIFISPAKGGIICKTCAHEAILSGERDHLISLKNKTAELLLTLLKSSGKDFEQIDIPRDLTAEAISVISGYVDHHVAIRLKSRDCIRKLKGSFQSS
ncbi:MAG: DNA repair protein RecO [Actinomycetota bacterium]|nr:DNA repair protein RecO [Actinomycetota bacterium]